MSDAEVRDWAWDWAKKLKQDIHRSQEFFDDISSKCAGLPEEHRQQYSTVLSLTTSAYYEYSVGNWAKCRAAAQCDEMSKMLKELTK